MSIHWTSSKFFLKKGKATAIIFSLRDYRKKLVMWVCLPFGSSSKPFTQQLNYLWIKACFNFMFSCHLITNTLSKIKVTITITNLFFRSWNKAILNVTSLDLWLDATLNTHLISRVCMRTCFYTSFIFIKLFNFVKMTSLTSEFCYAFIMTNVWYDLQ